MNFRDALASGPIRSLLTVTRTLGGELIVGFQGRVTVLTLTGEHDSSTTPELRAANVAAVSPVDRILDISGLLERLPPAESLDEAVVLAGY